MWIKIKYCIMLNNAEDIILNITDILTLPWPGHLNLALTNIEVARLCGFDQNSVNHPGILLWPIQRSFLLWMKLTHVVDRHLTTQMAAQRLDISAGQCRRLLSRYRESGPPGMANRRRGNPSNNQLPDGFAQYGSI